MRNIFLLLVALLCFKASIAQHPHDEIDLKDINFKFLEYLVKTKIDSLRKSKALNPLISDSVLYMASADHAEYQNKTQGISHFQKNNDKKKSPQKRAEFYGANDYFVGENVALIYLYANTTYAHVRSNETHIVTSYDQAASELVINWVNSRGHYANIITPSYEITAVALAYDSTEKALYAVQMFAEVSGKYEPKTSKSLFPYSHISYEKLKKKIKAEIESQEKNQLNKFEWRLKRATKAQHCRGNTDKVFNSDLIQPYIGGSEIGICTYDLARLKRFFRHRKDGLALEIIGFSESYSCDNELAESKKKVLKGESLFAGKLTKPIYRNDILRQIRQHELEQKGRKRDRNRCCNIILANTPEGFYDEHKEIKLVIIRKRRVCTIMSFRSLCGNLISYQAPKLEIDFSLPNDSAFFPALPQDKMIQRIRFVKNSIDFDASKLDTIIEVLKDPSIQIKSLDIKAFASIEGNIEDNKGLYQARAMGVLDMIQEGVGREVPHRLSAEENWRDFMRDIGLDKQYKYLLSMDSVELRNYLNVKENSSSLEALLAKHRYTYVRLLYSPKAEPALLTSFAADEFNAKILRFRKAKKIPEPVYDRLIRIQTYLFLQAMETGDMYYDSLIIPETPIFFPFKFRNIQFEHFKGDMGDLVYFVELEKLRKRNKNKLLTRAYQVFLINNSGNELFSEYLKPSLISTLIADLQKEKVESSVIEQLQILYHFSRANSTYIKYGGRNLKRAKSSINFLFKKFENDSMMYPRFKYSLARYFVLFYKFDYALALLEKEVQSDNPNPYDLSLYLKILAMRDLESPSSEFRQLLKTAIDQLGEKKWCGLFIGQCNIPMDIFEFESILNMYCSSCRDTAE